MTITAAQQAIISKYPLEFAALGGLPLNFAAMNNLTTFELVIKNGSKIKRLHDINPNVTPQLIAELNRETATSLLNSIESTCAILKADKTCSFQDLVNHTISNQEAVSLLLSSAENTCAILRADKNTSLAALSSYDLAFLKSLLPTGETLFALDLACKDFVKLPKENPDLWSLLTQHAGKIKPMLEANIDRNMILGGLPSCPHYLPRLIENVGAYITLAKAGYNIRKIILSNEESRKTHYQNAIQLARTPVAVYDQIMASSDGKVLDLLFWNANWASNIHKTNPNWLKKLNQTVEANKLELLIQHEKAGINLLNKLDENTATPLAEQLNSYSLDRLRTILDADAAPLYSLMELQKLDSETFERAHFLQDRFYHIDRLERIHNPKGSHGESVGIQIRRACGGRYPSDKEIDATIMQKSLTPDHSLPVMTELDKLTTEELKALLTGENYRSLEDAVRNSDDQSALKESIDNLVNTLLRKNDTILVNTEEPSLKAKAKSYKPLFTTLSISTGLLGTGAGVTLIALPLLTQLIGAGTPSILSITLGVACLLATAVTELFLAPKAMGKHHMALFKRATSKKDPTATEGPKKGAGR